MTFWMGVPRALWAYCATVFAVGGVIAVRSVFCLSVSDWAAWVQAIGSIAAIMGAFAIANDQRKRDRDLRAESEQANAFQYEVEARWMSSDVLDFLNQFIGCREALPISIKIEDNDVADLLERLAWCRQRARDRDQLEAIGTLRRSLMQTNRLVLARTYIGFTPLTDEDVKLLTGLRNEALGAWALIQGVEL
ncbi:hypothetical protein [Pandoraea terrigena]|uniref:Uncharacterized protein n=1 Tax=Pandoraea terrigena TaxID=2508292 RepID=A0A5E4Z0D2_9BURK|nr:hypothetical protein [Pandoraea terrigena]VVE54132.1 hypothetical protein PTE31013_04936 [Pandoraea terrigena]